MENFLKRIKEIRKDGKQKEGRIWENIMKQVEELWENRAR
jgi:transketolase N-terminal domain/subunit